MNVSSYFKFGMGIDRLFELIQFGIQLGLIRQNGSWYYIKDKKTQGEQSLYKLINENPEIIKDLEKEVSLALKAT